MRKIIFISPLVVGAMVLGGAAEASAASSSSTDTLLTITEGLGSITITAPTAGTLLPALTPSTADQTVSAGIGPSVVQDRRGNDTGWVVSASATDFTSSGLPNIPVTDVAYATSTGSISHAGVVTVAPTNLTALSTTAAPVLTATGVAGANTVTWTPTITLTVPGGTQSGTYTSTLTQSVT
jgi:hypothetical protein